MMDGAAAMPRSVRPAAPSPRTLRLGVALSFLLMLSALATFALSLRAVEPVDDGIVVNITASGCEPNRLEVPSGQRTFTIVNQSQRAVEWEIIDGVMVLEERENIAPGMRQPLTTNLATGDYDITCGLLSNPHGTLHVVAGDADAAPSELSATAFVGPLAEYRVYTTLQVRQLDSGARELEQAIAGNDLHAAQAAYRKARRADLHLAMPVGLFSDLDQRLNARADYFAKRQDDPDFTGFHRLAHGLFEVRSTAGLEPVAQQLVEDIETLKARLKTASIPPTQLANGSARVLEAWHDYQHAQPRITPRDLADLVALTEGADKIVSLLSPLLESQSPQTLRTLQTALAALQHDLSEKPDQLAQTTDDTHLLKDTESLAKSLDDVNRALALEG